MTAMKTGIIRFNLKDRMRKYNGQERHFDIAKLVDEINSPRTQERVKLGDLNGFYGHWPRIQFGAEPQEGGVVNGKVINLEPCFRTTYLKAFTDGTVEHEAEFFSNEPGKKAFEQIQSKSGGFSSVITANNGYRFHGFDFVREPNFSGNRPYAMLDGVNEPTDIEILVLDDAVEMNHNDQKDYIAFLQDSVAILTAENQRLMSENQQVAESIQALATERDLLLDDIVIVQEKLNQKQQQQRFDSLQLDAAIREAESFKTAKLEKTEDVTEQLRINQAIQHYDDWLKSYGY